LSGGYCVSGAGCLAGIVVGGCGTDLAPFLNRNIGIRGLVGTVAPASLPC
jgi:hypothetical protein